ncbi:MAG: Polymyxin resistance protein ArnT [Myxococcaceae bacterium]|nr:Polymyxin resistance protein ArnT [Myxococcaceae bacterium]
MASEAEDNGKQQEESRGLAETILGKSTLENPTVKKFLTYPLAWRVTAAAAAFASLLFIPYLGAVGLWDPWETHYGEVAREMIQRRDYVHPYWENAWFFSKPAFTMWMQALGMQLTGSDIAAGTSHLGKYTEWGFRLPFALFSVLAIGLLAWAMARTVSARAALATAFVLATMPMWFLLSRQAVTDNPVVCSMVCAMACAIVGLLDKQTRRRSAWWYGFYVFCATGTLAKGLLGFGIPAVILVMYAVLSVIPWNEKSLEGHARWFFKRAGLPLFVGAAAAALAWALTYVLFDNKYYGITPAAFAFFGVTSYLLHKAIDKAQPLMPLAIAGAGLSVVAAGLSATQQVRNLGIGVGLLAVGAVLYLLANWVKDEAAMPVLWGKFYEMRFGTGVLLFFAIALPWYHTMFAFPNVDDEGKLFWYRFLIHDHFARLGAGVHTTTPGGSFIYFIEQGGFAIYPWVLLVPGGLAVVAGLKLRSGRGVDQVGVIATVWLVFTFALIGASATKFHHYVFPMLPPMAILIGIYLDKVWTEGLQKHALSLMFGLPLLLLVGKDLAGNPKNFTDLFVYNYDRPYPTFLTQNPVQFWTNRALSTGDLVVIALLGIGGYLCFEAFGTRRSPFFRALALLLAAMGGGVLLAVMSGGSTSALLLVGLGILATAGFVGFEALRPANESRASLWALALVLAAAGLGAAGAGVGLKAGGQPDPLWSTLAEVANAKQVMGFGFTVFGLLLAFQALARAKTALFATGIAAACIWAFWFSWSHWVDLSHHWTQRDQFWAYYQGRKPSEPITSFLMNWRGETFYSRNTVKQIKDNNLLFQYAAQPGREWALVEHARLGILKGAVGPDKTVTLIKKDLNNKFVLVTID